VAKKKAIEDKFIFSVMWIWAIGSLFELKGILYSALAVSKWQSISAYDAWQLINGPYDPTMRGTSNYFIWPTVTIVFCIGFAFLMYTFYAAQHGVNRTRANAPDGGEQSDNQGGL
jgi:hypothetical protein